MSFEKRNYYLNHFFHNDVIEAQEYLNLIESEKSSQLSHFFEKISDYIIKLQEENPNISHLEIQRKLDEDAKDLLETITKSSLIASDYMYYKTFQYLQDHPDIYSTLANQLKDNTLPTLHLFDSLETYRKNAVLYNEKNYHVLQDQVPLNFHLQNILDSNSPNTKKLNIAKVYIASTYPQEVRKTIFDAFQVKLLGKKTALSLYEKQFHDNLKKELITSITSIIQELDRYQILPEYIEDFNEQMTSMHLEDFGYTNKSAVQNLYQLFSERYLNAQSIETLMALNMFWMDKFSKEVQTLTESFYAIKDLHLIPQILAEHTKGETYALSENMAYRILLKMYTLSPRIQYFLDTVQDKIQTEKIEEIEGVTKDENNDRLLHFSANPLKQLLKQEYSQDYLDYFSKALPESQNILEDDIDNYFPLQRLTYITNLLNNWLQYVMLSNLENNKDIINGGIVVHDNNTIDTIIQNKFAELAIDEHLTFPVKVKIPLTFMKEHLSAYKGNAILPVYEGIADFSDPYDKALHTSVVAPFNKKQEKLLKTISDDPNHPFLSHLRFLQNPKKVPNHLQTTYIDPIGKEKKTFERKYIDLYTGEIFIKQNDTFILWNPSFIR